MRDNYLSSFMRISPMKDILKLQLLGMCLAHCVAGKAQSLQGLGYEQGDRRIGFRVQAGYSSLCHDAQTCTGAHPVSHAMGTGGSFPGVKPEGRVNDHSSLRLRTVEL
jgi:hypothetical protein